VPGRRRSSFAPFGAGAAEYVRGPPPPLQRTIRTPLSATTTASATPLQVESIAELEGVEMRRRRRRWRWYFSLLFPRRRATTAAGGEREG